jgi:hypothetical protein
MTTVQLVPQLVRQTASQLDPKVQGPGNPERWAKHRSNSVVNVRRRPLVAVCEKIDKFAELPRVSGLLEPRDTSCGRSVHLQ